MKKRYNKPRLTRTEPTCDTALNIQNIIPVIQNPNNRRHHHNVTYTYNDSITRKSARIPKCIIIIIIIIIPINNNNPFQSLSFKILLLPYPTQPQLKLKLNPNPTKTVDLLHDILSENKSIGRTNKKRGSEIHVSN